MPSLSHLHRARYAFLCLLWVISTCMVQQSAAVPPAAPTEMTHQLTRAGFSNFNAQTGAIIIDNSRWCHLLRWRDNALDEEGYQILMRYGNFGGYSLIAQMPPNSNEILIPTWGSVRTNNIESVPVGTDVQFQIISWKYNGATMETTTTQFNSKVPPKETKPGFLVAAPQTPLLDTDRVGEPTNLTITTLNDGSFRMNWQDNCSSEIYYEILYGEQLQPAVVGDPLPAVTYRRIGFLNFNTTSATISNQIIIPETATTNARLTLVPGKSYRFAVRGTRRAPNGITALFNEANPVTAVEAQIATKRVESAPVLVAALPEPTELSATTREQSLVLTWKDNAHNETGYRIERKVPDSDPVRYETVVPQGATTEKPNLPENATSATITLNKQRYNEVYRVVALYIYRPQGQTTDTTLSTPSSTTVTVNGPFEPPANLTAVTSPDIGRGVFLTWEDKNESEFGFDILTRPANAPSGTPFHFARAVRNGVKRVTVTSRTETNSTTTLRPIFIDLEPGVSHEFVVRAVGDGETVYSVNSNTATAQAKEGFKGNFSPPIVVGKAFSYTLTTTNDAAKTSWNVANLPPGLTFNVTDGKITGTPTASGLYLCPMTAAFGPTVNAQATLTLRILPGTVSPTPVLKVPVVGATIPSFTVGIGTPFVLPLGDKFSDPDTETGVRLTTTKGNIDLVLYPSLAPKAVSNFLAYINGGDYKNMIFHRHVAGFVLQGGSIRTNTSVTNFEEIQSRTPLINEPGISNVKWTVAAAKLGSRASTATVTQTAGGSTFTVDRDDTFGYLGDPDSATTDFFINLNDNTANLDFQNGGFTAYARVATATQATVNTITALPVGNYGGAFSTLPVDAASAPSNLTASIGVRVTAASVVSPLSYSVDSTSTNIATVTPSGNDLRITGLVEGTRAVALTARDLDGQTVTQNFTITVKKGHVAPAITRHPVSTVVIPGAAATFSVTATGSAPMSFQWRRNGVNITPGTENVIGQNTATLRLTKVQAGNTGEYDVLVGNATTTLTSSKARLDLQTPTDITGTLPHRLIELGKALELEASVTGHPTPTFAWRRDNKLVTGQTSKLLKITAAKLTDAGIYKGTATNTAGSDTTTDATVCIVDKTNSRRVVKPGVQVKLLVPAAGPFTDYIWRKDGTPIPPGTARYSGMNTATLTIDNATVGTGAAGDSADYTCEVIAPNGLGNAVTGIIRLAVSNKPVLKPMTGTDAPGVGAVGAGYAFQIPYEASPANSPTRFTITGLPPGLSYDAPSGIIFGRPTKAGVYAIKAFAENDTGNSKPETPGTITILTMGSQTVGTFQAAVEPSQQLNGNKAGRLDLVVSDTSATFSAKLQMGAETFSAAGISNLAGSTSLSDGSTADVYQCDLTFARNNNRGPLFVRVQTIAGIGDITGFVTDGLGNDTTLNGYRQTWHSTRRAGPFSISSVCNIGLSLGQFDSSNTTLPQGNGFMRMTVGNTGVASIVGETADGNSFTASSIIMRQLGFTEGTRIIPSYRVMLYQTLAKGAGSIRGNLSLFSQILTLRSGGSVLAPERTFGTLRWFKESSTIPERKYDSGFTISTLNARGNIYIAPDSTLYSLDVTPKTFLGNLRTIAPAATGEDRFNALLDFNQGGLAAASRNPDYKFAMRAISAITPPPAADNLAQTKLSVTNSTGSYSGSFSLLDGTLPRNATYKGLMIPPLTSFSGKDAGNQDLSFGSSPLVGAGYFMLAQLPTPPATDIKLSQTLSGSAALQAMPVRIGTQPISQTVNPGATVTFAITTNETGPVTFQWRRNGVNLSNGTSSGTTIAGATTATLTLTNVLEANEGTYDCVLDNTFTFTFSAGATLTVNDPVAAIVVSRTPSTQFVATGSQVTYTVTSSGTTPITYQWQKNGTPIPGATSATYQLASVTAANDEGDYTVVLTNIASPSGVTSSANTLKVANPVTAVVATRTPATEYIALSSTVTFSVTAQGTPTLRYQWQKNGNNISGATDATYVINTASNTDEGNYSVLVSNDVTTNEPSNTVPLIVAEGISNIVVTKSFTTQAVLPNTPITFSVTALGAAPITFQWRKNGVNISGETTDTLNIISSSTASLGSPDVYDVLVINPTAPTGVASESVPVNVAIPVTNVIASRTPSTETVIALTDPIVFSVIPDGSGPYTYRWRLNGNLIAGANSATLTIPFPNLSDSGNYDCIVGNQLNPENEGTTSNVVPLTVIP